PDRGGSKGRCGCLSDPSHAPAALYRERHLARTSLQGGKGLLENRGAPFDRGAPGDRDRGQWHWTQEVPGTQDRQSEETEIKGNGQYQKEDPNLERNVQKQGGGKHNGPQWGPKRYEGPPNTDKTMMELRTVIVEDEAHSREILRNYLGKYCEGILHLGEAPNIEQGLALIQKESPDLVFLDVEMPFGNAFDLLERIPERSFEIVFVTAYDQYAKDALNQHAAYYLMKPINIDELIKAVDYVREIKQREKALEDRVLKPMAIRAEGKITLPQQDGFQV